MLVTSYEGISKFQITKEQVLDSIFKDAFLYKKNNMSLEQF